MSGKAHLFTYLISSKIIICISFAAAKQAVSTAGTEKKQSEMELEHIKSELVKKEKQLNQNSKSYSQDVANLAKAEKEVAAMAVSARFPGIQ